MSNQRFFYGDKYEIRRTNLSGVKANIPAFIAMFVLIVGSRIETMLYRIYGNASYIPNLVGNSISIACSLFILFLLIKKLLRDSVVDVMLIAFLLLGVISILINN
jgi:predicted membrane channel-forming protein YqfA (hemolysin III family)